MIDVEPTPRAVRALRWATLLIPVLCFRRYVGLETLDVRRGDELLRGDWVTYIAAPNFLRGAPFLDLPVGQVPRYMWPVGTTLGLADSFPVLTPVYRVLLRAMPSSPVQLVGVLLLVAFVVMFAVVRDAVAALVVDRRGEHRPSTEIIAAAAATVLITQPFFVYRIGHVSLMHQWVVVWALIVAFREPTRGELHPVRLRALLPVLAAAVLSPYLAAMVVPIAVAPLWVGVRRAPLGTLRAVLIRAAVAVGVVVVTSVLLGYLGGSARADNIGFGDYSAALDFLIDTNDTSRIIPDVGSAVRTHEGFGYVGAGMLAVMVTALALWWAGRRRRVEVFGGALTTAPVLVTCAAMVVYALLPVVRFGTWTIVDLEAATDVISPLTGVFRTNGRFVWPLVWALGLLSVGTIAVRLRAPVAVGVLVAASVLQLAEIKVLGRPAPNPDYEQVEQVIRQASETGVERVEIQPPWVMYECQPHEWGQFDRLGNIVVASSVVGVAINSGYAARGGERLQREICLENSGAFRAHQYALEVLYVIPTELVDEHPALVCEALPGDMAACRYGTASG